MLILFTIIWQKEKKLYVNYFFTNKFSIMLLKSDIKSSYLIFAFFLSVIMLQLRKYTKGLNCIFFKRNW